MSDDIAHKTTPEINIRLKSGERELQVSDSAFLPPWDDENATLNRQVIVQQSGQFEK